DLVCNAVRDVSAGHRRQIERDEYLRQTRFALRINGNLPRGESSREERADEIQCNRQPAPLPEPDRKEPARHFDYSRVASQFAVGIVPAGDRQALAAAPVRRERTDREL